MTDDRLLTEFRSAVPFPDEATTRRIYGQATSASRRLGLPRRRHVLAVALVAAAGVAAGLAATYTGEGSHPKPERQKIVDDATAQVEKAFGDGRIRSVTLGPRGTFITIDTKRNGPANHILGPAEGVILANVVDEQLRTAGYDGLRSAKIYGWGTTQLKPYPALPGLSSGACDIPPHALTGIASASGRLIPLLGGFCDFRLTLADPVLNPDAAGEALGQLRTAVPAAGRTLVFFEVDDENGTPLLIATRYPDSGASYHAPGTVGPPTF